MATTSVLDALSTADASVTAVNNEPQVKAHRTEDKEVFDQMGDQNKALFIMMEKMMDNKFDKQMGQMDTKLQAVATATDAGLKELKKEIETEKQARVELHKDLELVKKSVAGPSSRTGSSYAAPRGSNRTFVPDKVWIKGYIKDWAKKDETSLTKPKVMEWAQTVCGEMPTHIKDHVDLEATERYANKVLFTKFAIRLKNATNRDVAWSVKNDIERIVASGKCPINDVKPKAVVEPSPEMKPYIDAGGKFMGALQSKGVDKNSLRPEWGPPVKIFDVREPSQPVRVAQFDGADWTIEESALQALVPDLRADDLKTALKA